MKRRRWKWAIFWWFARSIERRWCSWAMHAVTGDWACSLLRLTKKRHSLLSPCILFKFLPRTRPGPGWGSMPSSVRSRIHALFGSVTLAIVGSHECMLTERAPSGLTRHASTILLYVAYDGGSAYSSSMSVRGDDSACTGLVGHAVWTEGFASGQWRTQACGGRVCLTNAARAHVT